MNKVFNVNLGGYPFTIDDDAYSHLETYLNTIHRHFESSEGYEEITSDIESRMAELFQESLISRKIITIKDVKNAIQIMGTPEDFGAEGIFEEDEKPKSQRHKIRTGKRLFLNPEDEVIGGVCSGIAAYLGIEDPLWVRLAYIVLAGASGGFFFILYMILWTILPKAETAGDRLAMRGEAANVSNIGKMIEEEIHHFSDKMSELGEEFKSKKKGLVEAPKQEAASLRKGFLF